MTKRITIEKKRQLEIYAGLFEVSAGSPPQKCQAPPSVVNRGYLLVIIIRKVVLLGIKQLDTL
jgi:hypothetical protein